MRKRCCLATSAAAVAVLVLSVVLSAAPTVADDGAKLAEQLLAKAGIRKGICAVVGSADGKLALAIVRASDFLVDVREPDADRATVAAAAVDVDGLWVRRIIVEQGPLSPLPWATNTVDLLLAAELTPADLAAISPEDVLRVLRPKGKAILGSRAAGAAGVTKAGLSERFAKLGATVTEDTSGVWAEVTKPVPAGVDSWSHWEKGPDNNPVSNDTVITPPYSLQWVAKPYYVAMPAVTTVAGGRTFTALGNITHHAREWPTLLTLTARDGYNGQVLWTRQLPDGYMVHRSAFIATEDVFYMIDGGRALKLDPETGSELGEVRAEGVDGEWKWMAMVGRRLYVLVGEPHKMETVRSRNMGTGWWWTGMSSDYKADILPWIWGKTIACIDLDGGKVVWRHDEKQSIDARGMVTGGGSVFFCAPDARVACLDADTGTLRWENPDPQVLALIKQPGEGLQGHPGFRSDCISLYTPEAVLFEETNQMNLVALSTKDGRLLWNRKKTTQRPNQIYLDGKVIGALGSWGNNIAIDPLTGKDVEDLRFAKYGCVRITANPNSIFTRGEGILRYDRQTKTVEKLTAIRPGCNDGVISANGLLYVGPWFCDCDLSLIGAAGLSSAKDTPAAPETEAYRRLADDLEHLAALEVTAQDWPVYRANNDHTASAPVQVAGSIRELWRYRPEHTFGPSPLTSAGGLIFFGGDDGKVRALGAEDGRVRWTARTAGPVRLPPTICEGRAYVGSGDGCVYVFEAATGRGLWRARTSPAERKLMVYGALCSTWPVNSGVLVDGGVAYAAGGVADFSLTHVLALDAVTGKVKWRNDDSGHLQGSLGNGVSVQGDLAVASGQLLLAGGNQVSPAVFDLGTGALLSSRELPEKPHANRGQEMAVFRGRYLIFGGQLLYSSPDVVATPAYYTIRSGETEYRLAPGRTAPVWSDKDFVFTNGQKGLTATDADTIEELFKAGLPKPAGGSSGRESLAEALPKERLRWNVPLPPFSETLALVLSGNAVVAVDEISFLEKPTRFLLSAYNLKDGSALWQKELPGPALRDGLLVDRAGRVIVALASGELTCFGGR